MLSRGCAPKSLCAPHLLYSRLIIRAGSIGPPQRFLYTHGRQRFVWLSFGQIKFLSGRKSDGARQHKFLLGITVSRDDELLLTRLKFNLRAQSINRRHKSRALLIVG